MVENTAPLRRLIEEFETLPGIGARTAERLAYHILKAERDEAMRLADAIRGVKDRLSPCKTCFNIAEGDVCDVCRNPRRDASVVCVVETPRDVIALESMGRYEGIYHVLEGRVVPQDGVGPENLTLVALRRRIEEADPKIEEVIVATNPDAEGDATALVLKDHLAGLDVRVSRLARGLPTGGSIEFSNVAILRDALETRRPL